MLSIKAYLSFMYIRTMPCFHYLVSLFLFDYILGWAIIFNIICTDTEMCQIDS